MEHSELASPERAATEVLNKDIHVVAENPVIDEILRVTSGLLAVLNAHRQILAVNESFLKALNLNNAEDAFGLRPGEVIKCVHAEKTAGGCGTTEFCSTCGAAISIVSALCDKQNTERTCAVTVLRNGKTVDMFFKVRCTPIYIENNLYLLLILRDISKQQEWANLERVFYHDINNIIYGILGRSELLSSDMDDKNKMYADEIFKLSLRLSREIEIQKSLSQSELKNYEPVYENTEVSDIIYEIENLFSNHIAAKGKKLSLPEKVPDFIFSTDISLLLRILSNMIINAFEASGEGEEVKVSCIKDEDSITFNVWNRLPIPLEISKRIFQRNFTTKNDLGRGLGTYSMKYFGEEILKGKMSFTTSEEEGTTFSFRINH